MAQKYRDRVLTGSGYSNKAFECDYAKNLLKKMGWNEGQGLGKEKNGIKECIQQKRRVEQEGLGSNEQKKWNVCHK